MVFEDTFDPVALFVRDVEASRPPVNVRELLAGFAHDRRIDNRHHLVDVVVDEAEEQRLVPVLQAHQVDIALQVGLFRAEVLVHAIHLLLHRTDGRRQQPVETETLALVWRKRGAFVRQRVEQQRVAVAVHGDVFLARRAVALSHRLSCLPRV